MTAVTEISSPAFEHPADRADKILHYPKRTKEDGEHLKEDIYSSKNSYSGSIDNLIETFSASFTNFVNEVETRGSDVVNAVFGDKKKG